MLKIIKRLRTAEWMLMIASILLVVAQVYMDLKIPDYLTRITVLVKTPESEMGEIWLAGGGMLLCAVASMSITFISGFISARLASIFSFHLRSDIFYAVEKFSLEEIDRFSTASLITRSTNDVTQIQNFITRGLTMIIRVPITVTLALMKISGKHWQWSALTAGAVLCVLGAVIFVIKYAHPRFRRMQVLTDDLNGAMRENLTGIRVVRAYNAEAYQEKKFADSNDRLTDNALHAEHAMSVMWPTMSFVNNGLTVGIYLIGAFIIAKTVGTSSALTTFSEMIVFSNYASRILFAFMSLNFIYNMLPRAAVCADRINEVLDTVPSIQDGSVTKGKPGQEGTVEFRNVSFSYPDSEAPVLTGISFTANKGETVAFIGATGSGKTSLINLVPRFYDATEGEVLVDGVNVKEYEQKELRKLIGYAPQKAVLFTGTVESNIDYGENMHNTSGDGVLAQIKESVRIAQATDFVEKMDGAYEAVINRGGTNVSGGQKQRLSIARAVFRKPEIYIFDDTFSALDYKTDRALRAELKKETAGVTTLIVAQRIGTIRDADKIIVIDEGRIVGMGTHPELLKNCSVYREIAYTQLSEEELQ